MRSACRYKGAGFARRMEKTYPDPATRLLITLAALISVMMVTLDGTIAIIALPRIQSSLVASPEQIAWVLTSYLVAGAIATPLSGWLADRFGRIRVMALSVLIFTVTSLGCGLVTNIETLVLFRFIQGASGASLVPLSQVLLLDINPPERAGPAIAWFGMGALLGPMIGPTLGAWLTEYFSWRWIFLINLPLGAIAFAGLFFFAREGESNIPRRFDARGFIMLSVALTAFQLMLDRGQMLDWFSSTEIVLEATVAAMALYMFIVHIMTARNPFIQPAIFADRNFFIGTVLSIVLGVFLNGVIPIMTAMMQQLLGYPIMLAGVLSLPRAIGNLIVVFMAGRLVMKVEPRYLIFTGMVIQIFALLILSHLSLDMRQDALALVAFLQGAGSGFLFLPLMMIMFSTLPDRLRNEASTVSALTRSLGGAVGISLIQTMTLRDMAAVQSRLVEHVRPDNPLMAWRFPDFQTGDPASVAGMMGEVLRQTTVTAYAHSFQLLLGLAILVTPLALFMRSTQKSQVRTPPPVVHAD